MEPIADYNRRGLMKEEVVLLGSKYQVRMNASDKVSHILDKRQEVRSKRIDQRR